MHRISSHRRKARASCGLWLACAGLCLAPFASACGSQAAGAAEAAEFTPRHAALFDDGADLIENPEGLQGRWRSDWEADLDERLAEADWVATGKVATIHVEVDPENRATYHLVFKIDRTLKGEPPGGELSLGSREGAAGYASLQQHRSHLLNRGFVAFVRYVNDAGTRVPHFHLMPPSGAILRAVERHDAKRDPHRVKIIEHRQR